MTERLTIPETLISNFSFMSPHEKKLKLHWLRQFSASLYRDAITRGWSIDDALASVYLSGLNHGQELTKRT